MAEDKAGISGIAVKAGDNGQDMKNSVTDETAATPATPVDVVEEDQSESPAS